MNLTRRTAAAALLGLVAAPAAAQPRQIDTESGPVTLRRIAGGLVHPWGMAVLPDGGLLVTERPGRLRRLAPDGTLSDPLGGTPEVFASGQGGLLGVALDPDFARNRLLYLSFAEPGEGGASTALGRATLGEGRIEDFRVIFRQLPKVSGGAHFGGRIVFSRDGRLFLTLGERFKFDPAQDLSDHLGTVVRIGRDGAVPADNPFRDRAGARPEIWSYGHRNTEAAALHPRSGALWIAEMGPRGGDELNLPEPGRNHGWPVVSWGRHYSGEDIPDPPTRPEFADAIRHWTPVISPSGMIFYDGDAFPAWRSNLLIGSLSRQGLVRLETKGERITHEEVIALGARIRDVAQARDGSIYVLTDLQDGGVWQLRPAG